MKSTQARLPGTLPTPAEARQRLRSASASESATASVLASLRDRLKDACEESKAARLELGEVERTLLDAGEGSPEEIVAQADQGTAWKRLCKAEIGIENLRATVRKAASDHAEAERGLRTTREDLEAIRQGRRKR
jgi:hypothetical protein